MVQIRDGRARAEDAAQRRVGILDAAQVRAADWVERVARHELRDARGFPASEHMLEERDVQSRNLVAVVDDQHVAPIGSRIPVCR